jgi:hypothetical protein
MPSLRNDTGIITENRCSVKWSAFRPPRGQASCPGTPAVQSDGPRHRMGRPAFRLIPRAVEWVAGRSTRRSGGAPSVVRNAGRSRAGRASGVLAGRAGGREARAAPAVGSMDEPTSERSWPHRPFGPVCEPNVDRNRPQPTDGSLGEPFRRTTPDPTAGWFAERARRQRQPSSDALRAGTAPLGCSRMSARAAGSQNCSPRRAESARAGILPPGRAKRRFSDPVVLRSARQASERENDADQVRQVARQGSHSANAARPDRQLVC